MIKRSFTVDFIVFDYLLYLKSVSSEREYMYSMLNRALRHINL